MTSPNPKGAGGDHSRSREGRGLRGRRRLRRRRGDHLDAAVQVEAAPIDDGFELVVRDGASSAKTASEAGRSEAMLGVLVIPFSLDGRHQNGRRKTSGLGKKVK